MLGLRGCCSAKSIHGEVKFQYKRDPISFLIARHLLFCPTIPLIPLLFVFGSVQQWTLNKPILLFVFLWLFNFDSAISMPKKLEPWVSPTVHPNSLPQVLAKKKPLSWAQLILICLGPNNPNMHEHLPTCAKGRRGPTLGSVLIDGVEAVQTRTPHNSPIWKWSMMWEPSLPYIEHVHVIDHVTWSAYGFLDEKWNLWTPFCWIVRKCCLYTESNRQFGATHVLGGGQFPASCGDTIEDSGTQPVLQDESQHGSKRKGLACTLFIRCMMPTPPKSSICRCFATFSTCQLAWKKW